MEYIKLFQENLEVLDELNDGQIAQLFKAIRDYSLGREPKLDGIMKAIFIPIRQQLDKNQEQYDNICSRNKANIESRYKSGIPNSTKSTSGKSGIPNSTKKPEEQEQEQEYNKLNKFNLLEKSEILKIFESEKLNLVFMNFIENRKQQHKPITKLALEQNIKKINSWLEKYPVEAVIGTIENSIASNYQGIFEPKTEPKNYAEIMAREQKIEAEKKAESQKIEAIKAQISTYRSNLTDEKRLEIEQKAIVEILNERKITAEKFALSPGKTAFIEAKKRQIICRILKI